MARDLMIEVLIKELAAIPAEKKFVKRRKGPTCQKCGSFLRKHSSSTGKHYECPRHGFARNINSESA